MILLASVSGSGGIGLYGWFLLFVVLLILELATVGLVSIWFAAGALAAIAVAALGGGFALQVLAFLAVSIVLLAVTRPFARRVINAKTIRTNADALIGQEIVICERVDNRARTGTTFADGKEWTVRALDDGEVLEAGALAEVVAISGVKLIVEAIKEKQEVSN